MATKNQRKQRKKVFTAPLHRRQKLMSARLSKELSGQIGRRSLSVRKGDEVRIMRGKFKNLTGKVSKVSLKKLAVYIDGIKRKKVSGEEVFVPIHPSNIMIMKLEATDKRRIKNRGSGKNDNQKAKI